MRSDLLLTSTKDMNNEEWLRFRKRGLGASETGAIMGLSQYKSSIELFYQKIGEGLDYTIENMAIFNGKEMEAYVANLWQYWEGNEESLINNYRAGKKIRRMQRVNAYVQNPDYPWLFVSLDRKINKDANGVEGALEIKTIAGYESDKWESGIPPVYIIQVQTQLLVCDFPFGELAMLKDGRNFDVFPFERMDNICNAIVEKTHEFWQRVEKARIVLTQRFEAQKSFNMKAVEELTAELQELEPEPDGSEAFESFLKEKYKIAKPGERPGTDQELQWAIEHKRAKEELKTINDYIREKENYIKNSIRDMTTLSFGDKGKVSWKNDVNGVRRFTNKIKVPD